VVAAIHRFVPYLRYITERGVVLFGVDVDRNHHGANAPYRSAKQRNHSSLDSVQAELGQVTVGLARSNSA
jgi:hypothetical protein